MDPKELAAQLRAEAAVLEAQADVPPAPVAKVYPAVSIDLGNLHSLRANGGRGQDELNGALIEAIEKLIKAISQ